MNPLDHRKNWIAFTHQLREKKPLSDEQFEYLDMVFTKILNGCDPKEALGLKYSRGTSEKDAISRQKISIVLSWVACAIEPLEKDGEPWGSGLTLEEAFVQAETLFPSFGYSADTIRKYWYSSDKSHMQSPERFFSDPDSPI